MVEVVRSTVIDAPLEAVWAVLRDFSDAGPIPGSNLAGALEDGRSAATVGAVRAAATSVAEMSPGEAERRARAAWEHVREVHTRERFRENYSQFVAGLVR
jgi:hypothetical protein